MVYVFVFPFGSSKERENGESGDRTQDQDLGGQPSFTGNNAGWHVITNKMMGEINKHAIM